MGFDFVLTGGKIVDGCGNPWFWGDLGVRNGRIAQIAPVGALQGEKTYDMEGRFVAPGFIDIHTHSDLSVMVDRRAESMVRQGVTTEIVGNCGMSPAPVSDAHVDDMRHYWGTISDQLEVTWEWRSFADYLEALQKGGLATNIGSLVGHAALRIAVLGHEDREPTPTELGKMQDLLGEAMQAGGFGLSTGLVYPPGCFAGTQEILALARIAAQHGGLYVSHIRGERETILEAVAEAITIGREAGLPVQISHNAPKYGASCDAHANLGLVDEARAQGQDVTVDNDVHTDLGVSLPWALPQHLHDRGVDQIQALLRNPEARQRIKAEIISDQRPAFGPAGLLKHQRWDRIVMLHADKSPGVAGKSIEIIAKERDQDPFDTYFDLVVESGGASEAIFDYIDQENIRILLRHPAVMICSDGQVAPHGLLNDPPRYAPCNYGEFPGVLERYVREQQVLSLEEAVRKMTSFPAQRFGLFDRGVLRPGAWADIVVFDLERVRDRATCFFPYHAPLENYPHKYPEGIDLVFVNGVLVVEEERHSGALPGKVLKRT